MDPRQVLPLKSIEYPERDGRPMGESDDHRDEMKDYVINVLKDFFAPDPMVYVSGNNFLYYAEGDPSVCVCPDTYVVKGVPNRQRNIYKVWEEGGHLPCFALEVTSKNTRMEDLGDKMAKHRDDLGVREYFLFDPRADWVASRLRGYVLENGLYQPAPAGSSGRLLSRELGLEVGVDERHVRFFTPGSASPLPTREERADLEQQRAEQERQRTEQERQRAEQERQRADSAEEEVRRLRVELDRLRGGKPDTDRP